HDLSVVTEFLLPVVHQYYELPELYPFDEGNSYIDDPSTHIYSKHPFSSSTLQNAFSHNQHNLDSDSQLQVFFLELVPHSGASSGIFSKNPNASDLSCLEFAPDFDVPSS
ncbi:hypothetical protein ACQUWQ_24505, partial [Ralstonia pseudosolanacearum]|uniref:hypothetical protein n=1 Tax=Ralstonia pseudosolanacearum TaxID=1310165 RepID=UPI003D175DE2